VILVDANLLLYAEDQSSLTRRRVYGGMKNFPSDPVCHCWTILAACIRIATDPRVFMHPKSRLDQPCTRMVDETDRHCVVFREMLEEGLAAANLARDGHLAALAVEHGCELTSTDGNFARFRRLRRTNALKRGKRMLPFREKKRGEARP